MDKIYVTSRHFDEMSRTLPAKLEYTCDVSQSRLIINRRESCYKICDHIKRGQAEQKGALLSSRNMVEG